MFHTRLLGAVVSVSATACVALTAATTSAAVVSDTDFADSNWTLNTYTTGPGGTVTAFQDITRGNPVPARFVGNFANGGGSKVTGFHGYVGPASTFDPAVEPIVSLQLSIEFLRVGGLNSVIQHVGLGVQQNGIQYNAGNINSGMNSGGVFVAIGGVFSASDFTRLDGAPGTPDFSASGAPFTVGFTSWSNTGPSDGNLNQRVAYDNFSVTSVPTPGSAMLAGVAGLAALRRRRA